MSQTSTRKALGKGLEQLFNSEQLDFNTFEKEIVNNTSENEIKMIPVDEIRSNPYQPRTYFDEGAIKELSESIKEHGIIEPIIVKKSIKGYELVAGERRTKASILAGIEKIPAIVKDFNDQEMMEIALLENIQRENLSPIEEAQAYKNYMSKMGMTQEEVAKRFGKSRSFITNLLGLLTLPTIVQNNVNSGQLSMSHARFLSKLNDDNQIIALSEKIIAEGISVRQLENMSKESDMPKKKPILVTKTKPIRYKIYEDALREKTGSKATISGNKIVIPYSNEQDLDRIIELLSINVGE